MLVWQLFGVVMNASINLHALLRNLSALLTNKFANLCLIFLNQLYIGSLWKSKLTSGGSLSVEPSQTVWYVDHAKNVTWRIFQSIGQIIPICQGWKLQSVAEPHRSVNRVSLWVAAWWVQVPNPTNACWQVCRRERLSCSAGCQEVSWCNTRGDS